MDEIARHLSVSKKTIYKEFKDKNEIVIEICEGDVNQHRSALPLIENSAENSIAAIVKIMDYVNDYLNSFNPLYFYDMQKYHPKAWNVFKQFKLSFVIESVSKNLRKGQEEKLYRNDLNIEIIAKLRIAEMDAALDADLFSPLEHKLAEVHTEFLRHYLQGITTIKGHRMINKYFNVYDLDNVESDTNYALRG